MIQSDRIAFSLKIVGADTEIKGLEIAKASLQAQADKLVQLDSANKRLADPATALINGYQSELAQLDGIVRTVVTEQGILDAANKVLRNMFFPNDLATVVPSLAATSNVWTKIPPFALNFAIGKTYVETYPGSTPTEASVISPITTLISSAGAYADIELTTGENCTGTGMSTSIATYPGVVTLKTNLVAAVNALIVFLNAERALIVTTDTNATQSAQNTAAIASIDAILSAANTWLAYPDFVAIPGTVTTCPAFYSYNANLLAPTKLHSTQLTALSTAISTRISYAGTRQSQLNAALGGISQSLSDGTVTGSGYYLKRYNLILLRLNSLGGSLTQLAGLNAATGAQDTIKATIIATKALYLAILPTSALQANANGGPTVSVVDASLFAAGDQVYVYAENQEELVRGIKSINGNAITLNDVVPQKYRTGDKVRLYKDLT